jgi:cholesterol transport system auxiliary component
VERRFDDDAQRTRLVARGDLGRTSLILRLDVREFEARYAYPEAIPTVNVSVRARLAAPDGSPMQERTFEVRSPVAENRVSLIVDGLDKATTQVLGEVVAWTDAAAASAPSAAPPATPRTAPAPPLTPRVPARPTP